MIPTKKQGMAWIDIKMTHKKRIFLFYKKYSMVVVIFLFFCGKSVTLRDVLFCLFQDLLRITVIDFVETRVEYPKMSENMLNRILFLLHMINASAVHV